MLIARSPTVKTTVTNVARIEYVPEPVNANIGSAIQPNVNTDPNGMITPMIAALLIDGVPSNFANKKRPVKYVNVTKRKIDANIVARTNHGISIACRNQFVVASKKLMGRIIVSRSLVSTLENDHRSSSSIAAKGAKMAHPTNNEIAM